MKKLFFSLMFVASLSQASAPLLLTASAFSKFLAASQVSPSLQAAVKAGNTELVPLIVNSKLQKNSHTPHAGTAAGVFGLAGLAEFFSGQESVLPKSVDLPNVSSCNHLFIGAGVATLAVVGFTLYAYKKWCAKQAEAKYDDKSAEQPSV